MTLLNQRRLVIMRAEDHNGALSGVNNLLLTAAHRLGIPYVLVMPDKIISFTPGHPDGGIRVQPIMATGAVDIGRQIHAVVGAEPFDLILNAHGGADGTFEWRSGSPMSYAELFRSLPRSAASVLVNGCNGGSAMTGASALPENARLYALVSAASPAYNQTIRAAHELALVNTGRLTPGDIFMSTLLNAGLLAPRVAHVRLVAETIRTGGFAGLSLDNSKPNHEYLGNMLNSAGKPSFDNLKRLAAVLDVSTDYLLGRADDPANAQTADTLYRDLSRPSAEDRELTEKFIEMLQTRKKKDESRS